MVKLDMRNGGGGITHSSSHLLPPLRVFRLIDLTENVILSRLNPTRTVEPCRSCIWRANGTHMRKELRGGGHEIVRSDPNNGTFARCMSSALEVNVVTHHIYRKRLHTTGASGDLKVHRCATLHTSPKGKVLRRLEGVGMCGICRQYRAG
jgi:hypothetical protein